MAPVKGLSTSVTEKAEDTSEPKSQTSTKSSGSKGRAAEVLAGGGTQAAAAREAGVDRATVGRWLKDDEFRALVSQARGASQAEAAGGLSGLVGPSLKLLEDALFGEVPVPITKARLALDVVKAAASIEKGSEAGGSQLADKLAAISLKGVDAERSD